ncbi:hypothetical protein HYH03_011366 [Edaphochlamys debaryana]|uniref:Uncharacterized protein n=1 Tax=Edaphochlamys debaryana TaxID=47281 RepID=A0A836BVP1_9CHLO|nr:hypothetical protein HYH03_011366 [Edaphochlamys debaryana]|eukprot:KAG2490242.1 hypothetical protein HYH03_011366 [Edaphochlamys debaryana]
MLRAQPFHALSRQLEAATAALEAGRGGGGAGSGSGGRAGPSGGSAGGAGSNCGRWLGSGSGGGASPSGGGGHQMATAAATVEASRGGAERGVGGAGSCSGGGAGPRGGAGSSTGGGGAGSSSGGGLSSGGGGAGSGGSGGGTAGLAPTSLVKMADQVLYANTHQLTLATMLLGLQEGADELASPGLSTCASQLEAERSACVEVLAWGLAESGFLEHAVRLTLLLQPRLPMDQQRRIVRYSLSPACNLWRALDRASGPTPCIFTPITGDSTIDTPPPGISPAAAAHLRWALSGRCVQTTVLVYGVGTLRVADRGPSYGLPAELQTAGLALIMEDMDGNPCLRPVALELLLRQLATGSALPPPGPGASLELALRVGRAALGTAASQLAEEGTTFRSPLPPAPVVTQLGMGIAGALRLAVGALACGRLLLPRQRPSPLEAQRAEWWRLAEWAGMFGLFVLEEGPLRQLWRLMLGPILALWPDGRFDLDALPSATPPEVAAALSGTLTHVLCTLARPGGSGLALFLTPLLAYGNSIEGEVLVALLTALSQLSPGVADRDPFRQAAAAFLRATAEALGRCRGLGPAAEAPAGPTEAAAGGGGEDPAMPTSAGTSAREPPPAHLQQLRRLLAPWPAAEAR